MCDQMCHYHQTQLCTNMKQSKYTNRLAGEDPVGIWTDLKYGSTTISGTEGGLKPLTRRSGPGSGSAQPIRPVRANKTTINALIIL